MRVRPQADRLALEALEGRILFHNGIDHSLFDGSLASTFRAVAAGEHVELGDFLKKNPQFIGKNVWDAAVFNPTGSAKYRDFLFDPHAIEGQVDPSMQGAVVPGATASRGDSAEAAVSVMPDIVPLVGGSGGYLQPYIDASEQPGHNLLRFSTAVGNKGAAPITLTSSNSAVDAQGRQIVSQTMYKYDSATNAYSTDYIRDAGRFVWHNGHGHFHLEDYATYRLLTNVGGQPGPVATRPDGSDAIGDKIGFCLINISSSFTIPGTSTSSSTLPGYSGTGQPSTGCNFLQGISVGRADVYDSVYDGQWIDVSGIANGSYFLEVTLDGSNVIMESDEANNTVRVPFTLNASPATGGIQADRFEPNNTPETATNLGVMGVQTQAGLTAHITDEKDYFKFVAASSGLGSVQLSITDRDVNLKLFDSNLGLLGSSGQAVNGTSGSPAIETVNYNFVKGQTYYALAQGFGTSTGTSGVSSGYAIKFNILPTVDLPATSLASAATPGSIPVTRNGPTSSPLTVNLTYGGTAVLGTDIEAMPSSIIIGNEAASNNLSVVVKSGAVISSNKTLTITLSGGAGYVMGASTTTVTVLENVKPTIVLGSSVVTSTPQSVSVKFSEDVSASLSPSDLRLNYLGAEGLLPVVPSSVTWDAATMTATFGFASVLVEGRYSAEILPNAVTDAAGNAASGGAVATVVFLRGDMNQDGLVNNADISPFVTALTDAVTFERTFGYAPALLGDINIDGAFNNGDIAAFVERLAVAGRPTVRAAGSPPVAGATTRGGSSTIAGGLFGDSSVKSLLA